MRGHLRLVRSMPGARFVLVPGSDGREGHLSLRLAALWKPYLDDLLGPPAAGAAANR